MAGARNADGELEVFALDFAAGEDIEKLRVNRASMKLEDQLGNPRS
jgi:hypothetical protein